MKRRPGFLTRYAKHAGISVRAAAGQLERVGINYLAFFDFAEADRRREAWVRANCDSSINVHSVDDPIAGSLGEAQTRERHFKANLAELEYQERITQLVRKADVEREAFRVGRLVRDAILNVPSRLAGILASESDQRKVHDLLDRELCQALEALALDDPGGPAAP